MESSEVEVSYYVIKPRSWDRDEIGRAKTFYRNMELKTEKRLLLLCFVICWGSEPWKTSFEGLEGREVKCDGVYTSSRFRSSCANLG